jgi:hypothetical protein
VPLLSRTLCPVIRYSANPEFANFFGSEVEDMQQPPPLEKISSVVSRYHGSLLSIFLPLAGDAKCKDRFASAISDVLLEIRQSVQAGLNHIIGQNLQAVLVGLSLTHEPRWNVLDPFAPYHPSSIAKMHYPFGDTWSELDCPLAVERINSWGDQLSPEDPSVLASWVAAKDGYVAGDIPPESQYFYAAAAAIASISIYEVDHVAAMQRHIDHLEHKAGGPTEQDLETLKMLKTLYRYFRSYLLLPSVYNNLFRFLNGALDFLIRMARYDETAGEFASVRPSREYQHLPEFLANGPCQVLLFLYQYRVQGQAFEGLDLILRKLGILVSSTHYLKNPRCLRGILGLFETVAKETQPGGNAHLTIAEPIIKLVFPAVVRSYRQARHIGTPEGWVESLEIKQSCLSLFTAWLQAEGPIAYFRAHYNEVENLVFVRHVVDDVSEWLDNVAATFGKPRDECSSGELKACLAKVALWTNALSRIVEIQSDAIKREPGPFSRLPETVVGAFLKFKLNEKMQRPLPEAEYTPVGFLGPLIAIAIKFTDCDELMKKFSLSGQAKVPVDESFAFVRKAMSQADPAFLEQFDRFLARREEFAGGEEEEDPDDFPEDFACPVGMGIMRNPMKLPSGTRIDKSTLEDFVSQGSCTDPRTAIPFDPRLAEPDVELKQRVDEWLETVWKPQLRAKKEGGGA